VRVEAKARAKLAPHFHKKPFDAVAMIEQLNVKSRRVDATAG